MSSLLAVHRREYAVLHSIRRFGTVPGVDALHKINYFANLKTRIFAGGWTRNGPFSPEISYIFNNAYDDGDVAVGNGPSGRPDADGDISLAPGGRRILEFAAEHGCVGREAVNEAMDFAHGLLAGMAPRQIVALSYAHYIRSYHGEIGARRIWEIADGLNPEARFEEGEMGGALDVLLADAGVPWGRPVRARAAPPEELSL